jgi:hypothetical protein
MKSCDDRAPLAVSHCGSGSASRLKCRRIINGFFALALAWIAGCTTLQPPDAQPGLNAREQRALRECFYWQPALPTPWTARTGNGMPIGTPIYTSEQLDDRLRRSADPSLDGERAELQASELALALAAAGDEAFSAALARQTRQVREAVARSAVTYLWTHYHLHYPETEAMLQPYKALARKWTMIER